MKQGDKDTHNQIISAVRAAADDAALADALSDVKAADIAECFELLSEEDRSRVVFVLKPRVVAEVVGLLDEAVRSEVVDDMDTDSLTEIVSELAPDDAADVLGEMTEDEAGEILDHMDDEKSEPIEELLEYDEETAGGIMTPDVVAVPADATVGDAVEHIRHASQEEDLHEVFIVDADRKLVGIVPLRRLVTSAATTKLLDICDRDPVIVYANDDQETVVQIIRKYDASEAAVVDNNDRLIGRITHDDLLDVAEEEAEEDMLRMAGTDPAELDTPSVFRAARVRLTWLLPCMLGMLLTATVLAISKTQFDVRLFATLMLFVPMIGAMGGNSGIQISTVIVRGFATGEFGSTKLWHVFMREGRIVLVLAPACGLAAWVLVSVGVTFFRWLEGPGQYADAGNVAVAVSIAMTAAILVAGILGIALPFTFRKVGVDPAIASGPIVTTTNDVVCVAIYMLIAMAMAA